MAMTIPTVIRNHQTKVTIAKLKKIDNILQNTFNLMKYQEFGNEDVSYWYINTPGEFINLFVKYLNHSTICEKNSKKCFHNKQLKTLNGTTNAETTNIAYHPGIILNDGTLLQISFTNKENGKEHIALTGNYGQIFVDINGKSLPNTLGKDIFSYFIKKDKIIPRGLPLETYRESKKLRDNHCSAFSTSAGASAGHNGLGCTAWVIYKENMNYLDCDNLDWNGKATCK